MLLETQRVQEDNRLNIKAALSSLTTPSLIMLLLLIDCCGQIFKPENPEEAGTLSHRVSIRNIISMTDIKNAVFSMTNVHPNGSGQGLTHQSPP